MGKKRFLRDRMLDDMLSEIRNVAEKVGDTKFPSLLFTNSLRSIAEMYETNKHVLQGLEHTIEQIRSSPEDKEELIDNIVEAAAHIQIGLVSMHEALREDVKDMMKMIEKLKESIDLDQISTDS